MYSEDRPYFEARREHALMLVCEGVSEAEVGRRLGISRERARQVVHAARRRLIEAVENAVFREVKLEYESHVYELGKGPRR